MKKSRSVLVLLAAVALLVMAACDATGILPGEEADQAGSDGTEKTVYVGPELVDCVGVAPQQCLQVKEDPNADYTLWYNPIEGFNFEPGYEYELVVREETIENPPADGSSIQWTLVEEVSKTPVEGSAAAPTEEGVIKTIYVGPEMVDCEGEGPQTCLLVKEDPNGEYQFHYFGISGFDFEPGYEYELLVLEEPVANPPAGGSSLQWTLIEVVNQTPVQTATGPDTGDAAGRIVAAFIGPALVDCVGVAPQQCLQVKTNPDDDYSLFYDPIEGFEFEEGYEYELRVLVEPVQNPPADASALKYTMLEMVSKSPAASSAAPAAGDDETMAPTPSLEGPIWVLTSYADNAGQAVDVLAESRITAIFEDGQVSGSSGCNRYFGSYKTDGSGGLNFGPLGSTMMMCFPEEVMLQETAFLANMDAVTSYQIANGQLQMVNGAGETVLVFTAEEPISLTGTTWIATGYNNGREAVVSLLTDTEITAVFSTEGTVSGSAGCNDYRASYEAADGTISIGPAAATRKLCAAPEGIMEQEAAYLAAISQATTYRVDGNTLELRDADGAKLAGYVAADTGDPAAADTADGVAAAAVAAPESAETESAATAASEFAGTTWQWLEITTPVEQIAVEEPAKYEITFVDDSVIGVTADCNTGSGNYKASGGQISINITATTLALCPPESLSDQFIRNLNAAAIYFMEGENLFIDLMADSGTMKFAPSQ